MLRFIIVVIFVFTYSCGFSQDTPCLDCPPVSHGSYDSLIQAISKKLVIKNNCEKAGDVYVKFTVSSDASIKNIEVIKSLCTYADSTSISIVKTLRFTPGIINGEYSDYQRIVKFPFRNED